MTETSDMEPDDGLAAAEYALRLLPPEEHAAFVRRLASEPSLRAAVAAWEERFAALADEVEPVAPPAALRTRISAELFGTAERPPGLFGRLAFWRGLSFGGIAASLILLALLVQDRTAPAPGPNYVAEIAAEDASIRLVALYDPEAGMLQLSRLAGEAAAERDFELWLIPPEQTPISLGVLSDDLRTVVALPEPLQGLVPGALLAISDEPTGGSPTGQATGPVVAVGQVEAI